MSNFRLIDRETGFLMPPSVDEWLPPRHLARFVVEVVSGLDVRAMIGGIGRGAFRSIFAAKTASRLMPISSDAKTLDGLNVAVAVCDEIASHKTAEVYDALRTATGKRRHPLLLSISTISTATGNTNRKPPHRPDI